LTYVFIFTTRVGGTSMGMALCSGISFVIILAILLVMRSASPGSIMRENEDEHEAFQKPEVPILELEPEDINLFFLFPFDHILLDYASAAALSVEWQLAARVAD
jgi:hypothetical protein